MNTRLSISKPISCWLAAIFAIAIFSNFQARAQQGPEAAAAQALELFNAGPGQTANAIAAYEKLVKDYPTSTIISDAQFRLGYLYFQNGDLDKSIALLKKLLQPPTSPDVQELAYSLLPAGHCRAGVQAATGGQQARRGLSERDQTVRRLHSEISRRG